MEKQRAGKDQCGSPTAAVNEIQSRIHWKSEISSLCPSSVTT